MSRQRLQHTRQAPELMHPTRSQSRVGTEVATQG